MSDKFRKGWLGVGFVLLCIFIIYLSYVKLIPVFHFKSPGTAYLITQSYGGQMTRAIRNMMVQQCWAGVLDQDVLIAEPFSMESKLVHKPQIWSDLEKGQLHEAARFSDYYNLSYYNAHTIKHGSAQLITWENFLTHAPRVAVAVSIPTHSCRGVIVDSNCSFTKSYKSFVNGLMDIGFKVVKRICIICSDSHQHYKFNDFAKLFSNGISVFMDSWRNYKFTNDWIEIPDHCKLAENPESSNSLVPSASVVRHSRYYMDHFIPKERFVGVMLRIERFLTIAASGRSKDSVQSCLIKTRSLFDEIRLLKDLGVYVTLDIGKYGSGVMQNKEAVSRFRMGSIKGITELVESLLTYMYNTTVTLEAWEELFVNATGGISERGYIAMVQRNIASQADCLILMGGGSFLQVAGFQYLMNMESKGGKPCLRTVCVLDSFSTLFDGQ